MLHQCMVRAAVHGRLTGWLVVVATCTRTRRVAVRTALPCRATDLLSCYPATLPPSCHVAATLPYYLPCYTLPHCPTTLLTASLPYHPTILPSYQPAALLHCCPTALPYSLLHCSVTLPPCHPSALPPCCPGTHQVRSVPVLSHAPVRRGWYALAWLPCRWCSAQQQINCYTSLSVVQYTAASPHSNPYNS